MAWKKKLTNTEVGFTVVGIEPANKPGYVVVYAKYPTTDKTYTYVRKYSKDGDNFATTIDGCKIVYDKRYVFVSATRLYDTAGMKKATNPGGSGKSSNNITSSIKAEMEEHKITTPVIPPVQDGPIKHEKYQTIKQCLECNIPVYLAGPAGSGKNHTVVQIADELGWDFYFSNSVQQEYKLTGFIDAGGVFHDTEFYKACTSENDCIFFLDEMDASIPEVLVLLNAAIANGYFEFPNGRVEIEHVHFVAAGNTVGSGADELYTGRMVLDQATLDRFAIIEFDYDTNVEMSISNNNSDLVQFIHGLRKDATEKGIRATFSYRCIMMVTKLEQSGMPLETIIKIAVVKGLDADTIKTLSPDDHTTPTKYSSALKRVQVA